MDPNKSPQRLQNNLPITNPDGTPTLLFLRWTQLRQQAIEGSISKDEAEQLIQEWAAQRTITAGEGLEGGGSLDDDVTLALEDVPGVAGSYLNADITVDDKGRVIAAANGSGGGGGGTFYFPVVVGIPPQLVYAPNGSLVYVEITP